MTGSLKSRMYRTLALWVLITWGLSLGSVYLVISNSQTSNWDDKLQSIAVKLLQMLPADIDDDTLGLGSTLQLAPGVAALSSELSFQVWRGNRLLASTPGAPRVPLQPGFTQGFATVEQGEQSWRVYSVSDRSGRFQVQVGNDRRLIDADFQKHAAKAVSLAALGMLLIGLLMAYSVRRALQPVARLEQATRNRSRFDLTPLPRSGLPSELLALVGAFNHVLGQLDHAIKAERQFISDAAHELRTPLASLQAQLEVVMRSRSDTEREQALKKLMLSVQRSSRLSEQLLDMARLEASEMAPVRDWHDLKTIVGHVAHEFDLTARRQQRHLTLQLQPCHIQCDVDEMGILVRNLLDNALRYTAPGGTVRIRCGDDAAQGAFLEIADDGPGVPLEDQQAIFERFHRLRGNGHVRGSGIGLSLVVRIAHLHQARIETGDGFGAPGLAVRVVFAAPSLEAAT